MCLILAFLSVMVSCTKDAYDTGRRYSRVLIVYAGEHNNLSSDIAGNIGRICEGGLPFEHSDKAVLFIRHAPHAYLNYSEPTAPVLVHAYSDIYGRTVCDTLLTLDAGTRLTDPEVLRSMLTYVGRAFPCDHYGMLLSSHGSGWLPRFYLNSDGSKADISPLSFGVESTTADPDADEMDIRALAAAIPMHLDYMVFDACLMGGVEVAYELKDVTDRIVASVAEIMTSGMDYSNFTRYLLSDAPYSLEAFCRDYFAYYDAMGGVYRTATISLIDTGGLEGLADVCRELFAANAEGIAALKARDVQGFFTRKKHWFFDLEDVLYKAGASPAGMEDLAAALKGCVLYAAATEMILSQVTVHSHCGLSMYLPSEGDAVLDGYYKSLAWNKATGLVK